MDKQDIKSTLKQASEVVADLPEHLQEKAFEIAVGFLVGNSHVPPKPATPGTLPTVHRASQSRHGADVSDLVKVAGGNRDLYIVFMHEIENEGEISTLEALKQCFSTYKKDLPGNVSRDLGLLVAGGVIKQESSGRVFSWTLKEKGRQRYAALVKSVNGE